MARMTLTAIVGFSLVAWSTQACLAQSSTASPVPSPPPAVTQPAPPLGTESAPPRGTESAPPLGNDTGGRTAGRAALDACRGDMKALCGGVARGGGRKFACLKENQSKLSPGCQAAIQTVVDKGGGRAPGGLGSGRFGGKAMAACRGDIASVCAGVEKGKGGVGLCLRENAAKLSQPCQTVLAERKAVRQACKSDMATLCGGVEKGKARQACLREKQAQASPGCQQSLLGLTR